MMPDQTSRRDALARIAGGSLLASICPARAATTKGPHDYVIVEGHYDIWEISARTRLQGDAQRLPLTNFILPRKIEGGQSVIIIAAGGDSLEERDGNEAMFEGSMRALDMILSDIEKSNGKASIIRTKSDVPTRPNPGKLQFFLDIEGGGSIQANPEPVFSPDRSLALLRQFFRLGSRGMQLTHNGRNQLGDGRGIDKLGSKLTPFGVSVIQ
jgi:microsomal dipeptidase-like Zn-dependent dipeptidase